MDFQIIMTPPRNETGDDGSSSQGPSSLAAVAAAFVPTVAVAILWMIAFVLIRNRFPKIYSPRTFIGTVPEKDRTPCQNRSYFDWLHTMRVVPDKFVLYHQSIDSYLFLRFLRTLIFICVVGACLTWPILIPVNVTGGGKSIELDAMSIGNVVKPKHLYAHATVAWVFFSFVMFTVARERLWLIGLRQAWNLSKSNARRLSSRTVLYLSAPTAALDENNMERFFGKDAVRIWPATKAEKLQNLVSERDSKVEELESAELTLIQNASKKGKQRHTKNNRRNITYDSLPTGVKKSLRPTHRLKTTRSVGKQVDSITHFRQQLKEKENEVDKSRESNDTVNSHGGSAAVFVEFRNQAAAQQACQQLASADVLSLTPKYPGVMPGEVIWENLTLPPTRRLSQESIAVVLVIALIIFWSIPVGLVSAITNISYLADNFKWLAFLKKLPDAAMSTLSGLLPPLLLSLLASYVPNIFRYIFKTFGAATNTSAELKVLKWYYVFQVLQIFLVSTLFSGGAAVASQLFGATKNPGSIPQLLADRLPSASNTYLTYFVIQGLSSAPSNVLNYSDLLTFLFFDKFFDKTPRQKYDRYTYLRGMQWGKVFPKLVNFAIIAIVYSCVAPLVLGFAAIGLALFYYSYRYMLLFTVKPKIDTRGHCYALALQQILTGVYIAELCLVGLFSLRSVKGPTIMIAILFILTVAFNYFMNQYFNPLEQYLPVDLALESESSNDEQAPLLSSAEEGESDALQATQSHIQRLSDRTRVPQKVIDPVARFFQPHVFASYTAMKTWLREGDFEEDNVPEYSDEELKKAYLNPAYTSKTPVVWIPRDAMGVSKTEIGELEDAGIGCSDQGAWVDEDGRLRWSVEDFDDVPVFKRAVKW